MYTNGYDDFYAYLAGDLDGPVFPKNYEYMRGWAEATLDESETECDADMAQDQGSCYDEEDILGFEPPPLEDNYSDAEADADTLASAGWGTDEDYGYFGGDEF